MAAFRFASLGVVLLFLGCTTTTKPIDVDMPTAHKHFIVKGPDDPARR